MPFYEPNNNPILQPDYNKCTPVPVIVNFAPDGKMMPVSFGMSDLYDNRMKIKIDGVKYSKDLPGRTSYCCVYNNGRWRQECLLTYWYQEHLWVLENQ